MVMPSTLAAAAADPVFAAIEAHRTAWAEFKAEATFFAKKRGGLSHPDFRMSLAAYEAATDALASAGISTLPGLRAFTAYIADLHAYGTAFPMPYAIEAWHLSDAIANVSATLARVA